ncbi:MAG: hypothetical protein KC416_12335, partial [Myxococcales bacterium]|nr:hypothetical protein [Myxococcales bacterium]
MATRTHRTPTSPPPNGPPLSAEAERAARARRTQLAEEVAAEDKRERKAALLFEIAGLEENTLGDTAAAIRSYLASYNVDPSYGPPLIELVRILDHGQSASNLAKVLESRIRSAPNPEKRAEALVDRASLLSDRLHQPIDARSTLAEALEEDPESRAAALESEFLARTQGDSTSLREALERRAAQTSDHALKALLWTELAWLQEGSGDPEGALQILRAAVALPLLRWRSAEHLERMAKRYGRYEDVIDAIETRAAIASLASSTAKPGKPQDPYSFSRFESRRSAAEEAAALWYEAGRVRENVGDLGGAFTCFSASVDLIAGDPLFRLAQVSVAEPADKVRVAAEGARTVLGRGATGPWAAAFYARVARMAAEGGHLEEARTAIRAARQEAPHSIGSISIHEDILVEHGRPEDRVTFLEQRARWGSVPLR